MKTKIKVGEQVHEVDAPPLTVVLPGANMYERISYPDHFEIDEEACLYHLDRVKTLHPDTVKYMKQMFPHLKDHDFDLARITQAGSGVRHAMGRIDLTLKLIEMGVNRIAWQYPEAHLHPSAQAQIVDVVLQIFPDARVERIKDNIIRLNEQTNTEKDAGRAVRLKAKQIELKKELGKAEAELAEFNKRIEANRKRYLEQLKAKEKK